MKELVCRLLYGEFCDHRPSSDEDILIRIQDFEPVKQILIQQGFTQEKEVTQEELKKIQEVHFYSGTGFMVELHVNPIGYGNNWRGQLNDCFADVFQQYREIEVEDVVVKTMSH